MKLAVGPVDAVGNLWVIRAGELARPELAPISDGHVTAELQVTRRVSVDGAVVRALCAGRSVAVFERGAAFAARIERLAARLADIDVTAEWRWSEMRTGALEQIDDDRSAVAWFLRHSAEFLFVGDVAFEKRRRLTPPAIPRATVARELSESSP